MKRRLLTLALASLMLLSAFSCSKEDPAKTALSDTAEEQVTETKTEATAETETPVPSKTLEETVTKETVPPQKSEEEEQVTVYLLEEAAYYDSGYTLYYYDKEYNVEKAAVYNVEKKQTSNVCFEEKDENGMPCKLRTEWMDGSQEQSLILRYFADGKLKEAENAGAQFTGCQYEYDQDGNLIAKREYYDGILEGAVICEYRDGALVGVYGEDREGNRLFECLVENGRVIRRTYKDAGTSFSDQYEYDQNGNLVKSVLVMDGAEIPGAQYRYTAVRVPASRVEFLRSQQSFLLYGSY